VGLRDLLEVYTAALTLGRRGGPVDKGGGGGNGGLYLSLSRRGSRLGPAGRLSDALSSLADATCPALDALLRLPLARVVAALARFQALVEEVRG